MPHRVRTYLVPPELEDAFVAELWMQGTQGVRSDAAPDGRLRLEAWFAPGDPPLDAETAAGWRARGVEAVGDEVQPDIDWLAHYRETVKPFAVGKSLFVDPREPGQPGQAPPEVPDGRRLLRLPARAAFGTGSHESTGLVLELLEDLHLRGDLAGRRVLDVGTGTGVLCFAALLFGASHAVGFDVDPAAPFHARENQGLNRLYPAVFAGRLAALRSDLPEARRFDLALINVVPEQILPEMPALVRLLRPGGEAIFSGILAERGRAVLDRLRGLGFTEHDRRQSGDWIAFRAGLSTT
jgi:ribosomal protein L11 methyltransferase